MQGSGFRPTAYVVMEGPPSNLLISEINQLIKFADNTNRIVPEKTDVCLLEEFDHINKWANDNKMLINLSKTKQKYYSKV